MRSAGHRRPAWAPPEEPKDGRKLAERPLADAPEVVTRGTGVHPQGRALCETAELRGIAPGAPTTPALEVHHAKSSSPRRVCRKVTPPRLPVETGFDGIPASRRALAGGIDLAAALDAELRVISVLKHPPLVIGDDPRRDAA